MLNFKNSKVSIFILVVIFLAVDGCLKKDTLNLSRCLQACKTARDGLSNTKLNPFCRAIPNQVVRVACLVAQFASKENCDKFCNKFFS
jgi:hypothetical protein